MTTNHPEKLDEALIRPGRVDHQVAFTNATQTQIKELFERMYTNDLPRTKLIISSSPAVTSAPAITSSTTATTATTKAADNNSSLTPPQSPLPTVTSHDNEKQTLAPVAEELSEEELSEIAEQFSQKIPDNLFSPAEIQGFLLKRKKDPRRAVDEVEGWVEGMIEQKKKGGRVGTVQ